MSTHSASTDRRVFGLDLLRAFAILSVLYGHFVNHMPPGSMFQELLLFNGMVGVELFFVLSGFLIGGIIVRQLAQERFTTLPDATRFWSRRWYRTLPNYFLFLALFCWLEPPGASTALRYALFVQNLYWPIGSFFGVSWSLAVEEWFYLLLPLPVVILAARGLGPRRTMVAALMLILVASVLASAAAPFQSQWADFDSQQRKVVLVRLSSLMFGVGMVHVKFHHERLWRSLSTLGVLSVLPLAALHCLSFSVAATSGWYLGSKAAQVAFFPLYSLSCSLVLPWLDSWREAPRPVRAVFTWISDASYAMYLCHIPTLLLLNKYVLKVDWYNMQTKRSSYMLVYFIGTFVVAGLTRRFWELPWLRYRDRVHPEPGSAGAVDFSSSA